ncbi:MAG TPA: S53 family peptidase, partial [Solirubrobacteraceae bacterium]|nr:S53 family peptidase [Solirubrobacteraceae bacterium]
MLTRLLCVPRGGRLAPVSIALCTAAALLLLAAPEASASVVRLGAPPPVPQGATLVASEASVSSMQITIALEPRDPSALAAYANAVSSPGNADFHRYLSVGQFRARFAPAAATVRAVDASLRARGLRPGRLDASGLAINVDASGGAIEHAFDLTLSRVRLRDGRDAVYNVQAPALDSSIEPDVQAVLGLNTLYPMVGTLERDHADPLSVNPPRAQSTGASSLKAHIDTGGPQPCSTAVDDAPGSGGYTADQVASYYDFSPLYQAGDLGQGVTVALYELEPVLASDVAAYQRCYDTHTSINYVKVDGGAGTGAGSGEAALDIDQIVGLAPRVKLLVYQAPNTGSASAPYDEYANIADQDRASVVSTSWGGCEVEQSAQTVAAEDTLFEQMAAQGQTVVAAAGDSGSSDCFIAGQGGDADNSLQVDDPAAQPFVTGVGGTSLELGPFNTVGNPDETVWNNSDPNLNYAQWGISPGAGGGGTSKFWQMPSYQSSAAASAPWLNVVNPESLANGSACSGSTVQPPAAGVNPDYCREVPDVSADADPMDGYMSYWDGNGSAGADAIAGWQGVGGTSAAAPLWAAVFALAEASRACDRTLLGFANPALYAVAGSSQIGYASYFNDITADASASDAVGDNNDLLESGNR